MWKPFNYVPKSTFAWLGTGILAGYKQNTAFSKPRWCLMTAVLIGIAGALIKLNTTTPLIFTSWCDFFLKKRSLGEQNNSSLSASIVSEMVLHSQVSVGQSPAAFRDVKKTKREQIFWAKLVIGRKQTSK